MSSILWKSYILKILIINDAVQVKIKYNNEIQNIFIYVNKNHLVFTT